MLTSFLNRLSEQWRHAQLAIGPPRRRRGRKTSRKRAGVLQGGELLEPRDLLAITATVSYQYDTNNFFNTQSKRDVVEAAADSIVSRFQDDLQAITPGGGNSWSAVFFHPGTGQTQQLSNISIAQDEIIFYVGGRELGSTLGQGGPGGFAASGSSSWLNTVQTRGEPNTNGANATDFGPWGGSVAFDTTTNWHFELTTAGLISGETDFYSVAVHELSHLLGVGASDAWDNYATGQGFTGPASVAEYDFGGNVPLSSSQNHWASGTTDGGVETAMDPTLTSGTRKDLTNLDLAALTDVGWELEIPSGPPAEIKLTADDAVLADWYGYAVAIEGEWAAVGAKLDNDAGINAGSVYVYQRNGETWNFVTELVGNDTEANDQFGHSVSLSGDTLVVGAWLEDTNNINAGAAYVFEKDLGGVNNWGQAKKLLGSDTTPGDKFGWSVGISGDTLVIGASEDDPAGSASGAGYIFQRNAGGSGNWGEVAKLVASDADAMDRFGQSVAIDGDTIVVGASLDDANGTYSGSAYVFQQNEGGANNWGEVQKLVASDISVNDQFGYSVSIDGDRVIVGSWLDDYDVAPFFKSNTGSIYIFERDFGGANNWGEVTKAFADDPGPGNRLGGAVSLDGDRVMAGALFTDDSFSNSGSSYVFEKDLGGPDAWSQSQKFVASDPSTNDNFGISVALDGSTALVGAYVGDSNVLNSGAAYIVAVQAGAAPQSQGDPQQAPLQPGSGAQVGRFLSVPELRLEVPNSDAVPTRGSTFVTMETVGDADLNFDTRVDAADSLSFDAIAPELGSRMDPWDVPASDRLEFLAVDDIFRQLGELLPSEAILDKVLPS